MRGSIRRLETVAAVLGAGALLLPGTAAQAGQVRSQGAPGRCRTSQLQVWLGVGEGGAAAGSTYYPVEFTNQSASACSLRGFPRVRASKNGAAVGAAAHLDGGAAGKVVLEPGETAHAVLQVGDTGNYSPSQCRAVTAAGLLVTPPRQKSSRFIPFAVQVCSNPQTSSLGVSAISSGVGVPGE